MKRILFAALTAGMAASPLLAYAASPATGTLTVSANISSSCTVSNATLAFGTLTPGTQATGSTSISVSCQVGSTPTLWLSGGNLPYLNGAGQLKSGSNTIAYALTDVGGTAAVPDDTGDAAPLTLDGTGHVSYTVNGKILAGSTSQTTPVGSYSDVLTINVAY